MGATRARRTIPGPRLSRSRKPKPPRTPKVPPNPGRPQKRTECADGERPCPWISCRYHLAIDVNPLTGSIRVNHGADVDVEQMPETCVLDVAERGDHTLRDVASILYLTRERVRQIEAAALRKLRARHGRALGLLGT